MEEIECGFCTAPLDEEIDKGERCCQCRAPICFNCANAYGVCNECVLPHDIVENEIELDRGVTIGPDEYEVTDEYIDKVRKGKV